MWIVYEFLSPLSSLLVHYILFLLSLSTYLCVQQILSSCIAQISFKLKLCVFIVFLNMSVIYHIKDYL